MHFCMVVAARKGVNYNHLVAQYQENIDELDDVQMEFVEKEIIGEDEDGPYAVNKNRIFDYYGTFKGIKSKDAKTFVGATWLYDVDWDEWNLSPDYLVRPDGKLVEVGRDVRRLHDKEIRRIEHEMMEIDAVGEEFRRQFKEKEKEEAAFYAKYIKNAIADLTADDCYIVALNAHL